MCALKRECRNVFWTSFLTDHWYSALETSAIWTRADYTNKMESIKHEEICIDNSLVATSEKFRFRMVQI